MCLGVRNTYLDISCKISPLICARNFSEASFRLGDFYQERDTNVENKDHIKSQVRLLG